MRVVQEPMDRGGGNGRPCESVLLVVGKLKLLKSLETKANVKHQAPKEGTSSSKRNANHTDGKRRGSRGGGRGMTCRCSGAQRFDSCCSEHSLSARIIGTRQ